MLRSSSPAMSEISVGSPSPPPRSLASNGFHILNIKRLKPNSDVPVQFPQPMAMPQRRKSSAERIKSFSIADILGKKEEKDEKPLEAKVTLTKIIQKPQLPLAISGAINPHLLPNIPSSAHHHHQHITNHLLAERLQPIIPQPTPLLMLDLPTLHKVIPTKWDPSATLTSPPNINPSSSASIPIHPFFPPALLHYEQRLAWDYQRQLQEHFQAQAQLLRQMSMDPNIIPSEDGSERSRSSSAGSQCYSPEVNVAEDDDDADEDDDEEEDENVSEGNRSKSDGRINSAEGVKVVKNFADKSIKIGNDTPLDALFQLSTKNFDEDQDPATLNIFATRPNPKKKRKSRTAFTNHQIFELEKRFLYQKYLSPADRDEIAGGLGLSNAQVITWFQNRRAKLKRDMEELKKDVESVKQLSAHKSFLENVNDLSILKTRPVSRYQPPQHHHAEVHSTAPTHGNHITGVYTRAITGGLSEIIQHTGSSNISSGFQNHPITTTDTVTITAQLPHHHPQNHNRTATATTNTCNERREDDSTTTGSQAESVQPQQLQQYQQPRNLQINNSRG